MKITGKCATRCTRSGFRALVLAGLLTTMPIATVNAETLAISCGAVGQELQLCKEGTEAWAKRTGNRVKVISTPNSATERLALYQQILAAESPEIDVFQIDIIWPGILAGHFIDLSKHIDPTAIAEHFPAIVANNTVKGKLVALPWFTDAGVLYYRQDLLDKYQATPPQTWAELTTTAQRIQDGERAAGNPRLQGFVFQAKGYEGLTCNGLEWVDSFGGGTLVGAKGEASINNPQAVAALKMAAGWIGTIAPQGVLNYDEEESRGVFQSGNAVFMRNWPYAWALANAADSPVRGKVGVIALPSGGAAGKHSGVLGGWNLAVSRYSAHPELAADLVRYLTSRAEQKRRAIAGSYNPTMPALYKDAEVLAATPFFGQLYPTFANAVARPSRQTGAKYNRVSAEFYNTVRDVLSGQRPAGEALAGLQRRLDRLSRGGRW
ncbi:MAG: ABC transporter substrate-binding protein [Gammaproteobacteria bacterium]|nr:ABC transporter substrate-binding protein [Gammaproteobacteria bacterium]MBU1603156.1 ABC transporter substrate-binding protein [Gammaproteobacteria bacterium]MBU2432676.1 ABC transporter substrate-binding protein [Gammaproteobacteria bacterium]MBU2451507.1 ABC transporter substrate-binding protein [Gammaproteobacteria bacterium]